MDDAVTWGMLTGYWFSAGLWWKIHRDFKMYFFILCPWFTDLFCRSEDMISQGMFFERCSWNVLSPLHCVARENQLNIITLLTFLL